MKYALDKKEMQIHDKEYFSHLQNGKHIMRNSECNIIAPIIPERKGSNKLLFVMTQVFENEVEKTGLDHIYLEIKEILPVTYETKNKLNIYRLADIIVDEKIELRSDRAFEVMRDFITEAMNQLNVDNEVIFRGF